MKKKRKRKLKIGNLLLVLVLLIAICAGGCFLYYKSNLKAPGSSDETYEFTIENGMTGTDVLESLDVAGGIKNILCARIYLKQSNLTDFKTGTYVLNKGMDLNTLLTVLNDPNAALTDNVLITFIEGDWAKDIAYKVSQQTNVTEEALLNAWNDREYLKTLQADYPFISDEIFNEDIRIALEGYLFPNTYEFYKETSYDDVTRRLLNQMQTIYDKYYDDIQASDYTFHELLTLASIVQYESNNEEDMKMIAGVFYNRLNAGMQLQSSVTVCYALDITDDDDWMKCEVNPDYDSPYNTYLISGLPPGPILNPGEEAINAVLHPTDNDYYYFMADVYGDGSVYYAKTLEEHNANVKKYLY